MPTITSSSSTSACCATRAWSSPTPFTLSITRRVAGSALGVHHTDVVMVLSPIHTHIEHLASSLDEPEKASRRPNGSVLEARHPTSRLPPHRPAGHALTLGLTAQGQQCCPTGGSEI